MSSILPGSGQKRKGQVAISHGRSLRLHKLKATKLSDQNEMLKNEVAVLKRQMADSSANLFRHPDRSNEMSLCKSEYEIKKNTGNLRPERAQQLRHSG